MKRISTLLSIGLLAALVITPPVVAADEVWGPPQRGVRLQLALSKAKAGQGDTVEVTLRFQRHKDSTDDAITRFPEPTYRLQSRARLRLRAEGQKRVWDIPFRGLGGPSPDNTVRTLPIDGAIPEMTRKLALVPLGRELELPPGVYAVWAELDLTGLRPKGSRVKGELYREKLVSQSIVLPVEAGKTERAPVRVARWMRLGPETDDGLTEYMAGALETVEVALRPGLQVTAEWSLCILSGDGSLQSKSTTFTGAEEGDPITIYPRDSDQLSDTVERWIRLDVVQRGRGSARPHENAGTRPLITRWYRFGGDVPTKAPSEAAVNEIATAWHLAMWALERQGLESNPRGNDELLAMDAAIRESKPLHAYRLRDLPRAEGHTALRVAEPATYGQGAKRTLIVDALGRIFVADLGGKPVPTPLDLREAPWAPLR